MTDPTKEPCLYCSAPPGEAHLTSCEVFGTHELQPLTNKEAWIDVLRKISGGLQDLVSAVQHIDTQIDTAIELVESMDDDDDGDEPTGALIVPCPLHEIEPGVWTAQLAPCRYTNYITRRLLVRFKPTAERRDCLIEACTIGGQPLFERLPVSASEVPGIGFPLPRAEWFVSEAFRMKVDGELDAAMVLLEVPADQVEHT